MVSLGAMHFMRVILDKMKYHKAISIYDGRIVLLKAYNRNLEKEVSLRTLDRRIHEVTQAGLLNRWPRKRDAGSFGRLYTSAGTSIYRAGLYALKRSGIEAFNIFNKIKASLPPRKKRAHSTEVKRAPSKTATRVGTITNELVRSLKPS